jgi:hypothetical protein
MAGIGPIISAGRAVFLGGVLALTLLACSRSGPTFQWEGTWRGQRPIPNAGDNPTVAATLGRVEVTLHPNGTFDLFEAGLPKSGSFRVHEGVALLKVDRFLDRPIADQGSAAEAMNEELRLAPLKDGALLYSDPRGFDREPIRLERLSATPPDTKS